MTSTFALSALKEIEAKFDGQSGELWLIEGV